ncbi:MAG: HDOD domain-containing protein [Steroidobacteraceae bacterium]
MPPSWIGLPILAAIIALIWLLARRARRRSGAGAASPVARGRGGPIPVKAWAVSAVEAAAQEARGSAAAARDASSEARGAPPEAHGLPPEAGPTAERADGAAAQPARTLTAEEILDELAQLAFDVTPLGPPASADYDAIAPRIGAVLEVDATELRHAPRRPLLLPQLLRAMRNDEVSRRELSKIIARDPALAGDLLKLANSSFYRVTDRPVESIDRAVALLGTDGIRSLVATALVQPVFDLSKQAFAHFPVIVWEHTYRTATAAEAHAAIVEDTDPFAAQLLGLTLGLGSIVVFRVALEQYARLAIRPDPAVIAALVDKHSAPVARRVAVSWELSERISSALEDQASSKAPHERTALGRSLRFGRLMGALAVLHINGRVSDETAKLSMLASEATAFQFESIWGRLTGRAAPKMPRPPQLQGSWRDAGRPGG